MRFGVWGLGLSLTLNPILFQGSGALVTSMVVITLLRVILSLHFVNLLMTLLYASPPDPCSSVTRSSTSATVWRLGFSGAEG